MSNTSPEKECRRKRVKTVTPPYDNSLSVASLQDVTNEELNNAAFHSSSLFDDEDIAATQIDTSHGCQLNSPIYRSTSKPREQNKENNRDSDIRPFKLILAEERSPTVLNRYTSKLKSNSITPDDLKSPIRINQPNQMSKSTAAKKCTPRRLFDGWSRSPSTSKKSPSPSSPQQKPNGTRKKLRLALSSNSGSSRMKQSTINFPKVRCSHLKCYS